MITNRSKRTNAWNDYYYGIGTQPIQYRKRTTLSGPGAIDKQRFRDLLLFIINCFMLMGGDAWFVTREYPVLPVHARLFRSVSSDDFETDTQKRNTIFDRPIWTHESVAHFVFSPIFNLRPSIVKYETARKRRVTITADGAWTIKNNDCTGVGNVHWTFCDEVKYTRAERTIRSNLNIVCTRAREIMRP